MRIVGMVRIEEILQKGEHIIADNGNEYELLESATCKENTRLRIYRVGQILDVHKHIIYFLKCAYLNDPISVSNLERESNFRFYYPYIEHVIEGFCARDSRGYPMYCVIFEYIEGWNLREYWKCKERLMQEGEIENGEHRRDIFGQMIQFLHGVNYYMKFARNDPYLHRDLKPENIMINKDGKVVIVDFDIAHVSGSTETQMWVMGNEESEDSVNEGGTTGRRIRKKRMLGGSGGYTAPEMYISIQKGAPEMPNIKSDIYSIGRLFFYWLQGKDYFSKNECWNWNYYCNNDEKLVYGLEKTRFVRKEYLSREYAELLKIIRKMCVKPEERYANITDIFEDMKKFLIQYCGGSEKKYEEYIRFNQMPLLRESLSHKLENAPNVVYEVYTAKGKYKKGKALLNHTMRDISVDGKRVMTIYNVDGIISYIPYEKKLYRLRQGRDYEIHPEEEFVLGDIRIRFSIH